jgi:hypothetical protein
MKKITIRFSARYEKMPMGSLEDTKLLAVFKVKRSELSAEYLAWDTKYADNPGHFQLSSGKEFLVLLLLTAAQLWTTIRAAWPPEKEEYYRSHVGEIVNIEIKGENSA